MSSIYHRDRESKVLIKSLNCSVTPFIFKNSDNSATCVNYYYYYRTCEVIPNYNYYYYLICGDTFSHFQISN